MVKGQDHIQISFDRSISLDKYDVGNNVWLPVAFQF